MNFAGKKLFRGISGAVLVLIGSAGCTTTTPPTLPEVGERYAPQNVYRAVTKLPPEVRRVILMPPTSSPDDSATTDALPALARTLEEELRKTARFELVKASVAELKRGFGRESFSATDTLPADLLSKLKAAHAGDAVLFFRITSYRAYPPVALGLELRLVTTTTGQTLWSVDETFDASQPEVARSAKDYFRTHHTGSAELADPQADLRSATRFSRYAMQAALATVPAR